MKPSELHLLQNQVQHRADTIIAQHPDWPCRKGCDACCRRLAELPRLTPAEAELIEAGLALLPQATRENISERRNTGAGPPFTCPFLDRHSGACLVYEHRPLACRAYGFYVERGLGLFCNIILERVERGEFDDVVWGNYQALLL